MNSYDRAIERIDELKITHEQQRIAAQATIEERQRLAAEAGKLYQGAVDGGETDAVCLDLAGREKLALDRVGAAHRALAALLETQAAEAAALEAELPAAAAEVIESQRPAVASAVAHARGLKQQYTAALGAMLDAVEVAASVRRQETHRSGASLPTVESFDRSEFIVDTEAVPSVPQSFCIQGGA